MMEDRARKIATIMKEKQYMAEVKEALDHTVKIEEDHASKTSSEHDTASATFKKQEAKVAELRELLKQTLQIAEKFADQVAPPQRAFPPRDIWQLLFLLAVVVMAIWMNSKWRANQENLP